MEFRAVIATVNWVLLVINTGIAVVALCTGSTALLAQSGILMLINGLAIHYSRRL